MLWRGVLLLAAAAGAIGQTTSKDAVRLTKMQMQQLRQEKPQSAIHNPILDPSQRAKLAEIAEVLNRWRTASEAMVTGLISAGQWPGSSACLPYPMRAFPSEFGLSESQLRELERLQRVAEEPVWVEIREKVKAPSELSNPTSPAGVQLAGEISKLSQRLAATRPPRDLALGVLNDAQRAALAVFETAMKLAREAIELKLIPNPAVGEPLCQ